MYPWDILGIEATDDKKVIKKTYAKLIKKYRPDEAPDKFQEINKAYQYALNTPIDFYKENDTIYFEGIYQNLTESNVHNEIKASSKVIDCIGMIDKNLDAKIHHINKKQNWNVIDELINKMSQEERNQVAHYSFQKCYDINNSHIKETGLIIINEKTLQHLDSLFNWSDHWQEYRYDFTRDCNRLNFNLIEGNNEYAAYAFDVEPWKRIAALIIDVTLIMSVSILRIWITSAENLLGFFIFTFILYQIIIELILRQETLGCRFMKYKPQSHFYTSVTPKQTAIRLTGFHLTFLPFYMILFGQESMAVKGLIIGLVFYILWLIAFGAGKKYIHDEIATIKMVKE